MYVAPAGHWEAVYMNGHPTLLSAATAPIKTPSGTQWVSTVVDANRGPLKSSRGIMTLSDGNDNDHYGDSFNIVGSEPKQ
jgi:hypothetical protein